ncbi:MAG: glycosyltransferase [Chthoniobacterales bacterium]|nr:glycosyltransferase [Chthoniobacterales bacterium]
MKIVLFYHSLVSDWNHGNAHFLRGVASELVARGHDVTIYEPRDGWSLTNLRAEQGEAPLQEFARVYPRLTTHFYSLPEADLERILDQADLVLVHEWNAPELVEQIGRHHARTRDYRLLFHDTHHRAVTDPAAMAAYDLRNYDGVLTYGEVLRNLYLEKGWAARAWTWHEAADARVFRPRPEIRRERDLVWIGNWGDEERSAELREYLIEPARKLKLSTTVHGVRYPSKAREELETAGIDFGGWLPNFRVPEVFARHRVTVHVPRGPYVGALPGIPTIRPFEALACGIPLISAPWNDCEHLFTPGKDFLIARNGREMERHLRAVLSDKAMARELAEHGRKTILARHTCAHRVDELIEICSASFQLAPSLPRKLETCATLP